MRSRKSAPAARTRRVRARSRPRRPNKRRSHFWLMRLALVSLIVISSMGLIGTAGTIGVVDYFAGDLPSIQAIQAANLTQTTRILDRNGTVIESLYHQNRTVVPLKQISTKLQEATIATEDRTFYSNSGVDYRRLAIAIVYDLTHHSSTLGASTITLPGFIDCTISAVISFGAGLPGISAVVMMMSTSLACFANSSRCAF